MTKTVSLAVLLSVCAVFMSTAAQACSIVSTDGLIPISARSAAGIRGVSADFDGDGKRDLAVAWSGGVNVTYAQGAFTTGWSLNLPQVPFSDIITGDFDGVRGADLVAISPRGDLLIVALAGAAPHTFDITTLPHSGYVMRLAAGDFNRDGRQDFVLSNDDGLLYLYAGNGDGTFAAPAVITRVLYGSSLLRAGDLNADGILDLITSEDSRLQNSADLLVFFGQGDGAFGSAKRLVAPAPVDDVAIDDLNGDHRAEIVTSNNNGTISVFVNEGAGTFAAPVSYSANAPNGLAIADMDNDGVPDVVSCNVSSVRILHNNGDGTLAAVPSTLGNPADDGFLLAWDIDGDGDNDLMIGTPGNVVYLWLNDCGQSYLSSGASPAVANPGKTVTYSVAVQRLHWDIPRPTGHVTFKNGGTTLSTLDLVPDATNNETARVTFSTSYSAAGTNTIVASYSGDTNYNPKSASLTTVVTDVTTSIALRVSASRVTYDKGLDVTPYVASSDGATITDGFFQLSADGTSDYGSSRLLPIHVVLPVGTHTLVGSFPGNAQFAASGPSSPVEVIVDGVPTKITLPAPSPGVGAPGGTMQFYTRIILPAGINGVRSPTGTMTVRDNGNLVTTFPATTDGQTVTVANLTAGRHQISVDYTGDDIYQPCTFSFPYLVLSGALDLQAHIDATGKAWVGVLSNGASHIRLMGAFSSHANANNGPWTQWQLWDTSSNGVPLIFRAFVSKGVIRFRAEALDAAMNVVAVSRTAVLYWGEFTDDYLGNGSLPFIQAVHLTELRTAIDDIRWTAGLTPVNFSEGAPAVGGLVRASHITELRSGLAAALAALGGDPVVWTTSTIAPGMLIHASDIQEIRDAIR